MIGQTISHYQIEEELGRGGMGVVFRARDTRLGRQVALKFLPPDRDQDTRREARLVQEAKTASSLNHPNILTIYDIGEHEGRLFIAMEFVEGETLEEHLKNGPLPKDEVARIAASIAHGLDAAHSAGLVHRDIKPSNIMITRDGRVKILDFGLAHSSENVTLTEEGHAVGTVSYASPEQARGEKVGPPADIWSLGVLLFEAVAGRRPFSGAYQPAVLYAVLNEDPPALGDVVDDVPQEWSDLVRSCLQKDPEDRRTSAKDIAAVFDGSSSVHHAPPPESRSFSRVQAAIVVILLCVVATIAWMAGGPRDSRDESVHRIAVLPIRSIGENPVSPELTEGLLYSITNELTRLRQTDSQLRIIPASEVVASQADQGSLSDLPFDADIVVQGTIQRFGDLLQLRFSLTDLASSETLDALRIDAPQNDLLVFQDEAAQQLARSIDPSGNWTAQASRPAGTTTLPEAYNLYLRAQGHLIRYTDESRMDSAIVLFNRAIELDPEYALAHAGLGEAYIRKYERTQDIGMATQAEQSVLRALSISENLPQVQASLGLILRHQGRLQESESAYLKALEMDPQDALTHLGLGIAYRQLDRIDRAEFHFKEAIRLRPDLWSGYNNLGIFYYQQGRYQPAAEQFREVIRLQPDDRTGYNNLAVVLERTGDLDQAVPMYEMAIQIDPNDLAYRNLGAVYYFDFADYGEAVRIYEQAVAFNDGNYRSWSSLANAQYWSDEGSTAARRSFERVISLSLDALRVNPNDTSALGARAEALAKTGRESEAAVVLESLKRTPGLSARDVLTIASVHEVLGERDSSLVYAHRALDEGVNPKYLQRSPWMTGLINDPDF